MSLLQNQALDKDDVLQNFKMVAKCSFFVPDLILEGFKSMDIRKYITDKNGKCFFVQQIN